MKRSFQASWFKLVGFYYVLIGTGSHPISLTTFKILPMGLATHLPFHGIHVKIVEDAIIALAIIPSGFYCVKNFVASVLIKGAARRPAHAH